VHSRAREPLGRLELRDLHGRTLGLVDRQCCPSSTALTRPCALAPASCLYKSRAPGRWAATCHQSPLVQARRAQDPAWARWGHRTGQAGTDSQKP
jgi:hypothetical protein